MQLLSCSPNLRIDIREERRNFTPKGDELPKSPELYVKFWNGGGAPDHLKARVEELPGFRQGIGPEDDPFLTRIGWWDSVVAQADHGWSDEDRVFVEERILQVGDPNVLVITEVQLPAPYDKYDQHRKTQGKRTLDHVIADITATYELAGFDVEDAVAYEKQNLADQRVIDALYGLVPGGVEANVEELVRA